MKRRLVSLLVVLTMLCAFVPAVQVSAYGIKYGDYLYYKVNDDNTVTITDCDENATSVAIPSAIDGKSVTSIGDSAFFGCRSLTSISLPSSVTSISNDAFWYCSSLTSISIPSSVTSIGYGAFAKCSSLTSINIPNSVTSIDVAVFAGCTSLTNIDVDARNTNYSSQNGILFSKAKNALICYPAGKTDKIYSIPSSVTGIDEEAFEDCSLTNINIPSSVTNIGNWAFADCGSLTSISIPNSVTSIGLGVFSDCCSLTSVNIPNSVTSIGGNGVIGNGAFEGCSSLSSINIPSSVTSIGDYAFAYCWSLTSISLPSGVTSIGDGAFNGCSSLKDVYYSGSEEEWKAINIGYGNGELTGAIIHYNGTGGGTVTPTPAKPTEQLREWNYSPTAYSHELAVMCGRLSAAMYPEYCYGNWDMFYKQDNNYDLKKKFFNDYGIRTGDIDAGHLGLGDNNIHYVISRSRKNANYNGSSRPLIFVVCKGTTGREWYGNMDITGTSYNSAQKNHASFQAAATGLEKKIGEYIKKNNLSNALVVVTGHSRGAAVANLTAYDLTMGKVSGVDKKGVYGYTFACPSTTQNPDTSLKNIYNFCFADDFVPAFPLDAWGYGKHGETHTASADYLKSQNSSFKKNIDMIADWSDGRKSHFAYARTKALFKYVPSKWRTISDYYNGHPQMLSYREPLTLYDFTRQYLARFMETGAFNPTKIAGMTGMLSTVASKIYQPVTAYLINGGIEGFMNDNHQMYTYYEALKTGKFDQKEYLPSGWDNFDINLFSVSSAEYNVEQTASLKAFIENGNNAELLGWDANDPTTWDTVTWNASGNVETISLYYKGLSGELDLTGFSDLRQLICSGNQITKLTLDGCNSLQILDCSGNLLEKLNLSLPALLSLDCEYNYLDTEDMSAFDTLAKSLELANYKNQNIKPEAVYNQSDVAILKTILTNSDIWDLNASPSEWQGVTWEKKDGVYHCVRIDLRNAGLTDSIDLSGMGALEALLCSDNEIGSLKISDCTSLTYLSCAECKLTELEISDTELTFLNCENNYLDESTTEAVAGLVSSEDGNLFSGSQLTDAVLTPTTEYNGKIQATAQYSNSMFRLYITPTANMSADDFKVILAEYDSEGRLSAIYDVMCEEQDDGSYKCLASVEGNCRVFVWNSIDGMKPVFKPLNINTVITE